jgi:nucleotidyltransferase/DNA polymerase involved in DNA repair
MPPCLRGEIFSPLLIVRTVADRQVIVALSQEAAAFGIRPGMTLTQARALCAHVRHAEHEPARDNRALEALARWMMRFSPVVSASTTGVLPVSDRGGKSKRGKAASVSAEGEHAHATIFLDLTGCGRLFGGLQNLVYQIYSALARMGLTARMAVAPTPGAAWALAEAGKNGAIVREEELAAALAPLPPAALRLSGGLVAALHHLGFSTIGQVANLPRDVLPARFGDELLLRLDQAMGNIAEPLVPLEHHAPVEARMDFDGPVSSLEAIHAVSRHLLQEVIIQLVRRGCGARQLDIELTRAYGPPLKKTISLSHPSRDMKSLFNLMACLWEDSEISHRKNFSPRRHGGTEAISTPFPDSPNKNCAENTKSAENAEKKHSLISSSAPSTPLRSLRIHENAEFLSTPCAASQKNKKCKVGLPAPHPSGRAASVPPCLRGETIPTELKRVPLHVYGDGYTSLSIRVPLLQRLTEEQIFLLEQGQHASRLEVSRLIDRLRLRLGEEGIVGVKLVESHLPERAWEVENAEDAEGSTAKDTEKRRRGDAEKNAGRISYSVSFTASPRLCVPASPDLHSSLCTLHSALTRPLHLFPRPEELRVIVTPSDAIEGRPAAFVYEHQVHRVIHCAGPERIAGVWWEGRCKTRDYFEVENPPGRRFWIFRVAETSKWYLHGG